MSHDFCFYAMGGMGFAILGMASYIVKQHREERKILKAWLNFVLKGEKILGDSGEVA